jgi:ribosome maturation factor RimP
VSATTDRVSAVVEPVVARLGLSIYDIDQPGGTVRVMLDAPGGIDIDTLTAAAREISSALDEAEPMAGSYTLEVSSPGLERPLRLPAHYTSALGERIKVKLMPGVDGDRRADGTLLRSDDDTLTIATDAGERTLRLDTITKASTVFEWSPPPKSTGRPQPKSSQSGRNGQPGASTAPPPTTESSEEHR